MANAGPNTAAEAELNAEEFAEEKRAEPVIMLSSMRRKGVIIGKIKRRGLKGLEGKGLDKFGCVGGIEG